ncbi:MAG: hypothetical protein H6821_14915 [Planctomycetaceae bacterium]|nr:hypothetical protein [Planctomycetales bacterium]MCB9875462.1 hypothetical protein [Planctomycetaceae bacterium]
MTDAKPIAVDRATSRIAFQVDFRDRPHWFAIQFQDGFDQVSDELHRTLPEQLQTKQIHSASMTLIIILLGVIAAAIATNAFILLSSSVFGAWNVLNGGIANEITNIVLLVGAVGFVMRGAFSHWGLCFVEKASRQFN